MRQEETNDGIVAVVAAPLIALSTIDLFTLIFGLERWVIGSSGRFIVMYGHLLFAIGSGWVVMLASRLGNKGPVIGLTAFSITYVAITRFRGPWIWQGTWDYWWGTMRPWIWSSVVGVVLGLAFVGVQRRGHRSASKPPADLPFIGILGLCGVLDYVASLAWPLDSNYAPTLHLALAGMTMLFLAFRFVFFRPEIEN